MRDFIRTAIRNSVSDINAKAYWTKDEAEVIALLKNYVSLNQTTEAEVEAFLQKNGILMWRQL